MSVSATSSKTKKGAKMKKQDKATEKEMKDLKAIEDAFKEFIPLGAFIRDAKAKPKELR